MALISSRKGLVAPALRTVADIFKFQFKIEDKRPAWPASECKNEGTAPKGSPRNSVCHKGGQWTGKRSVKRASGAVF
jgi:hypothetical protein